MVPFKTDNNIYYRFYHLYRKDEIEKELSMCNYDYTIIEKDYELGNYYIYLKKI